MTAAEKTMYALDDLQNATRDLAGNISRLAGRFETDPDTRANLQRWAAQVNEIANQMSADVSALEGAAVADDIAAGNY